MMKKFDRQYKDIIIPENILCAWRIFLKDKKNKKDIVLFQAKLMDNIFDLRENLVSKTYTHGGYESFNISDPKPRIIHKGIVRDRVLHHLLYKELYKYFDKKFIYDSYSCRLNKGTHKPLLRFEHMARRVSCNNKQTCWILKCDIRKFFANIDHDILKSILTKHIEDKDILWLLEKVIDSFSTEGRMGVGLPLGNLTSQLFVNVYMNEFDQFVKHKLKAKNYIRYADDFVFLSDDKNCLETQLPKIKNYLAKNLKLELHPDKLFIKSWASGVDFLGWVHFPTHRVLRTTTSKRMLRRLSENPKNETLQSYLGLLKHGSTHKLKQQLLNNY